MHALLRAILVIVGLINFYPVVGVLSAGRLTALYGIDLPSVDHLVLLQHRAVLFGLLGGLIILSAFRPRLRLLAGSAGMLSMVSFIVLALAADGHGDALRRIVVIDAGAAVALAFVMIVEWRITAGNS